MLMLLKGESCSHQVTETQCLLWEWELNPDLCLGGRSPTSWSTILHEQEPGVRSHKHKANPGHPGWDTGSLTTRPRPCPTALFSENKIGTHLDFIAFWMIFVFSTFLLLPDSSLPRQRACSPAEFIQRQTTHYLQEWNIEERRSGTRSPCAPLSSPEKPGIHH